MAYCAKCLTEYAQGFPECIDCRVPLLSGSPPAPGAGSKRVDEDQESDLIVVRRFTDRGGFHDPLLARSILEAEGVHCALAGARGPADIYSGIGQIELMVFQKDLARAEAILNDYLAHPPPSPPDDEPNSE